MSSPAASKTSTRTMLTATLAARGALVLGLMLSAASVYLTWQVHQQHSAVARRVAWAVQLQQPASDAILDAIEAESKGGSELQQAVTAARQDPSAKTALVSTLQRETHALTRGLTALWRMLAWTGLLSALVVGAAGAGAIWVQSLRSRLEAATEQADRRAQLLSALFAQELLGIYIFDGQGKPLYSAPNITRRRGLQAPDFSAAAVSDIREHPVVKRMGAVNAIERALTGELTELPAQSMRFSPAPGHDGPEQTLWLAAVFIPLRSRSGEVDRLVIIIRDETDKRALFERVQRAEHLAELGSLAQGVTHEINNPLTFVSMNLNLISELLDEDDLPIDDIQQLLADMNQGVDRIRSVTSELSELAAPHVERRGPVALDELLSRVLQRLQADEQAASVRITTQLDSVSTVSGTVERLELVFINLIENALSACEGQADGLVELSTGEDGDQFVWVEIKDSGSGISPEIQDRIFEPFFTTQHGGRGTGLGLYLVRCYLDEIGGKVDVKSTVGEGTSVRVTLPPMAEEPTAELLDSDRAKLQQMRVVEAVTAVVASVPTGGS